MRLTAPCGAVLRLFQSFLTGRRPGHTVAYAGCLLILAIIGGFGGVRLRSGPSPRRLAHARPNDSASGWPRAASAYRSRSLDRGRPHDGETPEGVLADLKEAGPRLRTLTEMMRGDLGVQN